MPDRKEEYSNENGPLTPSLGRILALERVQSFQEQVKAEEGPGCNVSVGAIRDDELPSYSTG